MGRKKIEIKMVKDRSQRQVTFSKRRAGLFKKANELAILCGAQVAIVAFSPGGKPFSFGFPSVHTVTQRFLIQESGSGTDPSAAATDETDKLKEVSGQLADMNKKMDFETQREELLDKAFKEMKIKAVSEMSLDEVRQAKTALLELRERIKRRVVEMEASSSLLLLSEK